MERWGLEGMASFESKMVQAKEVHGQKDQVCEA